MPHVIVKVWPGKSEEQKSWLAEEITKDVMEVLNYGAESVSVALQEIEPQDWEKKVYRPDILAQASKLYKAGLHDVRDRRDVHDGHMVKRRTGREAINHE
jgi:4-oxalocrotonate tautomerase